MNKRLVEEFSDMPTARLIKKYKSVNPETRLVDSLTSVCSDDYLLMNPFLKGRKVYHSEHIRGWWNGILNECNFKERYTIYSLRSTHITHALLKGMNVRVIAENCGTSQNEIETTYQRLNNLLNIDELGFFQDKESFVGEG
jgi:integrase